MSDDSTDDRRHPPFLGRLWQHHSRHAPSKLENALFGSQARGRDAVRTGSGHRIWQEPADAVSWLHRVTGSPAAAYVWLDLDGNVDSVVAPSEASREDRERLLDRARELFVSGELGSRADADGAALTWYANGALRAVLAAGARGDDARSLTRVQEFLDGRRERPSAGDSEGPPTSPDDHPTPGPARPRLIEVASEEHGDMARVTASLEWQGRSLVGSATGAVTEEGRHRAAARAVVRALGPAISSPLRMDRLRLISSGGARLAIAAVRLNGRVLTGAAAAEPGDVTAGARATLAALNRELTRA